MIDPINPFFGIQNLPDPATHEGEYIHEMGFHIERRTMVLARGLTKVNRFQPAIFTYRRMQVEDGTWVWTYPLRLKAQNAAMN